MPCADGNEHILENVVIRPEVSETGHRRDRTGNGFFRQWRLRRSVFLEQLVEPRGLGSRALLVQPYLGVKLGIVPRVAHLVLERADRLCLDGMLVPQAR